MNRDSKPAAVHPTPAAQAQTTFRSVGQKAAETNQHLRGQELSLLVRDLHTQNSSRGWLKFLGFAAVSLALLALTLMQSNIFLVALFGVLLGFVYASFMVLTHDAIHHTLTGNRLMDEILPRLLSWPMLWPHGTYAALHKLHHSMNGRDDDDPERCHLTTEEYERAGRLERLVARHQLVYRVFVSGGIGMILNLVNQTRYFGAKSAHIKKALYADIVGIVLTAVVLYGTAAYFGMALKLFVVWIILERTVGGVQQFRSHLEHYGLWDRYPSFLESQIYNTRNFMTNPVTSFYFNGLNYHSVHHAFPSIPYYHLREAHQRISDYCKKQGAPLHEEMSYARTALSIIKQPRFVRPMHTTWQQREI
jgi:fatty acid desaturase